MTSSYTTTVLAVAFLCLVGVHAAWLDDMKAAVQQAFEDDVVDPASELRHHDKLDAFLEGVANGANVIVSKEFRTKVWSRDFVKLTLGEMMTPNGVKADADAKKAIDETAAKYVDYVVCLATKLVNRKKKEDAPVCSGKVIIT